VFLKKILTAAQSCASSRRLGHAQPASRFAIPRQFLAQHRLNSASRIASGHNPLLKHEALPSAAVANVDADGSVMDSSPRSRGAGLSVGDIVSGTGGRPDLSRDLFSFLSSDPAEGGFPPPPTASAALPFASVASQPASRFSEVFPEMSSVLSHASSHSAAPFQSSNTGPLASMAAAQYGNRELVQERRDGNEEEFDSDDDESMIDWSLVPRETGSGRLEEDAWKRAHGVRLVLATDVLVAIQSQPGGMSVALCPRMLVFSLDSCVFSAFSPFLAHIAAGAFPCVVEKLALAAEF
jgi:hypothetical protein